MCWCGHPHPRGHRRNGPVRHWAVNWAVYLRRFGDGPEPTPPAQVMQLVPAPHRSCDALSPVALRLERAA